MKQKWENPRLVEMGVENTNEGICTYDTGHENGDKNHIHRCDSCDKTFTTLAGADEHQTNNPEHYVGIVLMS